MKSVFLKYKTVSVIVILILLTPALFINLGLFPLSADEGTRALVALEMEYSGNLITPTINGEFYFNKPPLYNWILLSFFKFSGSHSELIVRLPMIISLILFGLLIFFSTKEYTGNRNAFLSAAIFITCGRILFYDSMLGLIDTTFSLLIFLNFILIFRFLKKEKYLNLFLITYFITSLTFLMKGLPAVLFQGITLLAAFIWQKKFNILLSIKHFTGILLFVLIVGGYYFILWKHNPTDQYFQTLFSESAKRTFLEYGLLKTILNLLTFPFIQLYNLLPWSVLIIFACRKDFWQRIRKNEFLSYICLVFIVNIPVYWISVETYPRYMFMLYPLLLIVLIQSYTATDNGNIIRKIIDILFYIVLILSIPLIIWGINSYSFQSDTNVKLVSYGLIIAIIALILIYQKQKVYRPETLIILLLVFRIGFNLIVIPERDAESRRSKQKAQAVFVGEHSKGHNLKLQQHTTISHETTFYIERETGEILFRYDGPYKSDDLYIFDGRDPVKAGEEILYQFETRWQNIPLRLSRFRGK